MAASKHPTTLRSITVWSIVLAIIVTLALIAEHLIKTIAALQSRIQIWETHAVTAFTDQDQRIDRWEQLFRQVKNDLDDKIVMVPVPSELPEDQEWTIEMSGAPKGQEKQMHKRTWPYGTRKRVQVLSVSTTRFGRVVACAELDGEREGFILMGGSPDVAKEGDVGTIVFCQGGPTGGYWRYEADKTATAK
jgi:hypothetical protein